MSLTPLHLAGYVVSLIMTLSAMFFIARQKMSYLTVVRNQFVMAFLAFAALISSEIYFEINPSLEAMRMQPASCIIAATAIGWAVAKLSGRYELKSTANPVSTAASGRKFFYLYVGIMLIGLISTFVPQMFSEIPQATLIERESILSSREVIIGFELELWYSLVILAVLIAFWAYPGITLYLLSRRASNEKVKQSTKTLSFSIIAIAGSVTLSNLFFQEGTYLAYLIASVFFGLIAYSFRERTILSMLIETEPVARLASSGDAAKQYYVFSESIGLTHRQVMGRKILFEFDPSSDYEKAVKDFMKEAFADGESVALFTRMGSAIHSISDKQEVIQFFFLTQRVSVPTAGDSKNEILLPINSASLLLDALDEIVKGHPQENVSVIFDDLSGLVLSMGLEKTYEFLRYALEVLASKKATALFLFNPEAHDPKVAFSLRTLFNNQMSYGRDGLRVFKLSK